MTKVMIDVAVFITNCQVSENPNSGPVNSHTKIDPIAIISAVDDPVHLVAALDSRSSNWLMPAMVFKPRACIVEGWPRRH